MTALAEKLLAESGGKKAVAAKVGAAKAASIQPALFLTRDELARRWNVCWLTIRRMEKAGRLVPAVKFGQTARYSRAQIEAFETTADHGKEGN